MGKRSFEKTRRINENEGNGIEWDLQFRGEQKPSENDRPAGSSARKKEIKSVANVARRDISEFLELAAQIPIRPEVQEFGLEEANKALAELKDRKIRGAKVLIFDS